MSKLRLQSFVVAAALACAGAASAQDPHPVLDMLAQKVVQKYQSSSCADLAARKGQQPTGQKAAMEQKALQMLRSNPEMRAYFLNRVAGPIANKMFECGMIP